MNAASFQLGNIIPKTKFEQHWLDKHSAHSKFIWITIEKFDNKTKTQLTPCNTMLNFK